MLYISELKCIGYSEILSQEIYLLTYETGNEIGHIAIMMMKMTTTTTPPPTQLHTNGKIILG
jgi:hypothetical protein